MSTDPLTGARDQAANDPRHVYRPLLDLIGKAEGTDPVGDNPRTARGYNETLGYGAFTGGPVELVSMTLDEVDALQTAMLPNRLNSTASGRYQILRTTLRRIRNTLRLSGKALFDEAMQDRLACFLLGYRGIDKWLAGRMTENALINNLAREWASFPKTNGKSHYAKAKDGAVAQDARISVAEVRQALAQVRERHRAVTTAPKVPDAPPAPPVPETGPFGDVTLDAVLRLAERHAGDLDRAAQMIALAQAVKSGWTVGEPAPALPDATETNAKENSMLQGAQRWFKSRGVMGGIGAFAALIAPLFGIDLGEATINEATVAINELIAAVSALIAIWGRVAATRKITR